MRFVDMDQRDKLVRCLTETLDDLRRGPTARRITEGQNTFSARIERWYETKCEFFQYGVKCLRSINPNDADMFLDEFKKLHR